MCGMPLDAQLPIHSTHDILNWLRFGQSQKDTIKLQVKIYSGRIAVMLKLCIGMHRAVRLVCHPGKRWCDADRLSMEHEKPHLSDWGEDWVLHFLGQAIDHSAATRPQQCCNCSLGCYMRLSSKRIYCLLEVQRRHQTCADEARARHMH